MTDTTRDIITESLLDLGVLAEGETPTDIQASGALKKLNALLDSWSLDNLMVYGMKTSTLPMVANKQTYTIGTGGDLNINRPNNFISCTVVDTSLPIASRIEYGIPIYNDSEWADVQFKGLSASFPAYGINFNYEYPLIKANVWPVPNSSQYSINFYSSGILSNLAINDTLSLPSGYRRAIVSNLSMELAPSYGVQISAEIARIATASLSLLKDKNLQINELKSGMGTRYNIYTDTYR